VHAGDVREAFGVPGAYAGESAEAALALLVIAGRRRKTPLLHALLPGRSAPLAIGTAREGRPPAGLTTDVPTLIRLFADRPLVGARYELTGAERTELHIFG
jgi:hypothetical protein